MKNLLLILLFPLLFACSSSDKEKDNEPEEIFNPVLGKWKNSEWGTIEFFNSFPDLTFQECGNNGACSQEIRYTITKTHIKYGQTSNKEYSIIKRGNKTFLVYGASEWEKIE